MGRQKKVTDRIELVRHVFRRAIEVWLVLDRALYLQQQGYQVSMKTFWCRTINTAQYFDLGKLPVFE